MLCCIWSVKLSLNSMFLMTGWTFAYFQGSSNTNMSFSPFHPLQPCPVTPAVTLDSFWTASIRGPPITSETKSGTAAAPAMCSRVTPHYPASPLQLALQPGISLSLTAEVCDTNQPFLFFLKHFKQQSRYFVWLLTYLTWGQKSDTNISTVFIRYFWFSNKW